MNNNQSPRSLWEFPSQGILHFFSPCPSLQRGEDSDGEEVPSIFNSNLFGPDSSEEYECVDLVKYEQKDFTYLRVLGKGSFGKVGPSLLVVEISQLHAISPLLFEKFHWKSCVQLHPMREFQCFVRLKRPSKWLYRGFQKMKNLKDRFRTKCNATKRFKACTV